VTDRAELVEQYRRVLRRAFLFNSVPPIDSDALTSTLAMQSHLAGELGPDVAQRVTREEARRWFARTRTCAWSGGQCDQLGLRA
jgi:hypothetical protein